MTAAPTPVEITRANVHDVRILWNDGHESVFPARDLRLACSCAVCVHEMTGQSLLDPKAVPRDVRPLKILPVGRYAIQIFWSDNHNTGLYAFDSLRRLCPCAACVSSASAN